MQPLYRTTAYRYPNERLILVLTVVLVLLVIALTATATICVSAIFILAAVVIAYASSRSHHQVLIDRAHPVSTQGTPHLARLMQRCVARLQPGVVQVFVTPNKQLNAYTFGLASPKVVVLYSALLEVMDDDEMRFIIGHELGHVALGHTRLNSLVGGMAGIPSNSAASTLLMMAFLWWNRACEHSADRAGLCWHVASPRKPSLP